MFAKKDKHSLTNLFELDDSHTVSESSSSNLDLNNSQNSQNSQNSKNSKVSKFFPLEDYNLNEIKTLYSKDNLLSKSILNHYKFTLEKKITELKQIKEEKSKIESYSRMVELIEDLLNVS